MQSDVLLVQQCHSLLGPDQKLSGFYPIFTLCATALRFLFVRFFISWIRPLVVCRLSRPLIRPLIRCDDLDRFGGNIVADVVLQYYLLSIPGKWMFTVSLNDAVLLELTVTKPCLVTRSLVSIVGTLGGSLNCATASLDFGRDSPPVAANIHLAAVAVERSSQGFWCRAGSNGYGRSGPEALLPSAHCIPEPNWKETKVRYLSLCSPISA